MRGTFPESLGENETSTENDAEDDKLLQAANISEGILFVEFQQVDQWVNLLIDESNDNFYEEKLSALSHLRDILDKYLEFPTLLDRHVPAVVTRLTNAIRSALSGNTREGYEDAESWIPLRFYLSSLYSIAKVRGRKRVQKWLPHEVQDVSMVFEALKKIQTIDVCSTSERDQMLPLWESEFVLWIWMDTLSLVPFDSRLFSGSDLLRELLACGSEAIGQSGPTRDVAASCVASWLARPEVDRSMLLNFWDHECKDCLVSTPLQVFRALGVLRFLVCFLKCFRGDRTELIGLVEPMIGTIQSLTETKVSNSILRKFIIKWWTRLGVAYMPPRVAAWRYQRGKRSLQDNIAASLNPTSPALASSTISSGEEERTELFPVPDLVEDAMGYILAGLSDASTPVRWNAAKGVGRVLERLPYLCTEDVLDTILERLQVDPEKDHMWHGGCLALAEMIRRGLLRPHRLGDTIPVVQAAISFDLPRHQTSVGGNVRDAACYVCWALARAFDPTILKPFISTLCQSIVTTALLDREINIRRAASAAFQELVGRQGAANLPFGIAMLTKADYFSLGNRVASYTDIALFASQYEIFRIPILDHLRMLKLSHWDENIRLLASRSLGCLTPLSVEYTNEVIVPSLLKQCLDPLNVPLRHGATLGLAEIVLGFSRASTLLSADHVLKIVACVQEIEKARLYRGKGGELIRYAVCRLIECISEANIKLSVPQQVRLLDSVDASISHPKERIQEQACRACSCLLATYFPVGENGPSERLQKRVVQKYVDEVRTSSNVATTRGFAMALGGLPPKLLAPTAAVLDDVLSTLVRACSSSSLVGDEPDAETRRNSIDALSQICDTVVNHDFNDDSKKYPVVSLGTNRLLRVTNAFLSSLSDYTMDRRGDIGSWVRVAAMKGLESLLVLAITAWPEDGFPLHDSVCIDIYGGLLKQFFEKLDNVRAVAGSCLRRLSCLPYAPRLNGADWRTLHETFTADSSVNFSASSETFPFLVNLLSLDAFHERIVAGVVISTGCLTERVSKDATKGLVSWIKNVATSQQLIRFFEAILSLFDEHNRDGRVLNPLLKTLDGLITRMVIADLLGTESFAEKLALKIHREEQGCSDMQRLFSIVKVSVGLLQWTKSDSCHLTFLTDKLLTHRFPRIRRFAAEQLYAALLEDPRESSYATELLLSIPWDSTSADSKAAVEDAAKQILYKLASNRKKE